VDAVILPTIHHNGTSAQALYDQAIDVARAARQLLTAMQSAWPNGRDYYPQGEDALKVASAEWDNLALGVVLVEANMMALAEHASNAVIREDAARKRIAQ